MSNGEIDNGERKEGIPKLVECHYDTQIQFFSGEPYEDLTRMMALIDPERGLTQSMVRDLREVQESRDLHSQHMNGLSYTLNNSHVINGIYTVGVTIDAPQVADSLRLPLASALGKLPLLSDVHAGLQFQSEDELRDFLTRKKLTPEQIDEFLEGEPALPVKGVSPYNINFQFALYPGSDNLDLEVITGTDPLLGLSNNPDTQMKINGFARRVTEQPADLPLEVFPNSFTDGKAYYEMKSGIFGAPN